MMKEIASLIVLLALCIPALAIDMPDMIGNWTGTFNAVSWVKNTDERASGNVNYWDDPYTIAIEEQNGTRLAGKMIPTKNPLHTEILLGLIGSDNESINLVSGNLIIWGFMKSPEEMELFEQVVDIDYIGVGGGVFTKE